MRAFVDFFNQGWVGITIGLAVAVYIYWRSQRGARIAYHCKTIRVLGAKGHTLPEAVKITFKDQPIENLCRTLVMVWNDGAKIIEGKNIVDTDALRIELGDAAQVLDDRLVKVTREVNKCGLGASLDLSKVNWRQLVIEFDFLDPDDGCVIEIFHTDSGNKPKLIGTIRGMPGGFKNYKQLFPPPGYILPGASAVGVLALGYGVYAYNAGNITNGPTFILLGAILVTLSIGMLILLRRRHPKALSMPEFTRPFVMSPD